MAMRHTSTPKFGQFFKLPAGPARRAGAIVDGGRAKRRPRFSWLMNSSPGTGRPKVESLERGPSGTDCPMCRRFQKRLIFRERTL